MTHEFDGLLMPPTSPVVGFSDGEVMYGEIPESRQEQIEGINPETGERDGRHDGRITVSVPIQLRGQFERIPDPHAPRLLAPERELVIAPNLDALNGRLP